jgi:hypothetical protein
MIPYISRYPMQERVRIYKARRVERRTFVGPFCIAFKGLLPGNYAVHKTGKHRLRMK